MHNYHLINLLKNDIDISMISVFDELNSDYLKKINIKHENVKIPFEFIFKICYRFNIFIKYISILKDSVISKQMYIANYKINSSIIEFMDIHSESYYFLKKKKYMDKELVVIRSHTPWSLLKNYYSKIEKKYVDQAKIFKRESFCFQACDVITTPSNDLKKQLIELFNINEEKINVLPNIIDTKHFSPSTNNNKKNSFVILHVGRFDKSKGVETLIKSFIELAKVYDNIELVNVGKTNYRTISKYRNWLEEKSLNKRVNFKNFINYENLPKFYHNADVVIVPSEIYESFSYTAAQGMSCGKIVIGSKIGGIPETLNYGKSGILFEPGNAISLIKNIKKVYLKKVDIELMQNNARKYILDNFSFDALKQKYFDFYSRQLKLKK